MFTIFNSTINFNTFRSILCNNSSMNITDNTIPQTISIPDQYTVIGPAEEVEHYRSFGPTYFQQFFISATLGSWSDD